MHGATSFPSVDDYGCDFEGGVAGRFVATVMPVQSIISKARQASCELCVEVFGDSIVKVVMLISTEDL